MPKPPKNLPYRPVIDMQQVHAFDAHLKNRAGSWTLIHSFIHAGDPRVISLRWPNADIAWGDVVGFLKFLDLRQHRALIRCFLHFLPPDQRVLFDEELEAEGTAEPPQNLERVWSLDALLQQLSTSIKQRQLIQAIQFLCTQEYLTEVRPNAWARGLALKPVEDFDPTFSWMVQEHLQLTHHAVARRSVRFKESEALQLGDLDLLAFTEDGHALLIDCKSSPDISPDQIHQFVHQVKTFPIDLALLLVDTESEAPLLALVQQISPLLNQANAGERHENNGTIVYALSDNVCIANTAGGIDAALETVLQLKKKHLQTA